MIYQMSLRTRNSQIAEIYLQTGLPTDVRTRLGSEYESVLSAYVNAALDKRVTFQVFQQIETHPDSQLAVDLCRKFLRETSVVSYVYQEAMRRKESKLIEDIEEKLLGVGLDVAYNTAISVKPPEPAFVQEIFTHAVAGDLATASRIAFQENREGDSAKAIYLAQLLLHTNPAMAYKLARAAKNPGLIETARKAWAKADPAAAFDYGQNGCDDLELAKYALGESTKDIPGWKLYLFARDHIAKNEVLRAEGRRRYVYEDPAAAYNASKSTKDTELMELALASRKIHPQILIQAARDLERPALFKRAVRKLSHSSGLSVGEVRRLLAQ